MTFDDVIGQQHITAIIKSQIKLNKLSHAYLFTGTRGTGKTSCARILARAVNCEHPEDGEPCNECRACKGILSEEITDVVEIDAATNNGVDNIRSLREETVYTPASVKCRVYIIDEVHMLSAGAFNALLKVLEEPPEHVIFILATTEANKLPATILSRCQRFDFKRISIDNIAKRLMYIASNEGINLKNDGAGIIARLGDGSMRDSLSVLERCASFEGVLNADSVTEILGLAGQEYALRIMSAAVSEDVYEALSVFGECYHAGREITSLIDELIALSRDLLIIKTASGEPSELLDVRYPENELLKIGERLAADRIMYIIRLLRECTGRLRESTDKRLEAEMCIISMCIKEPVPVLDSEAYVDSATARQKGRAVKAKGSAEEAVPESSEDRLQRMKNEAEAKKDDISPKWKDVLAQAKKQLSPMVYAHLALCEVVMRHGEIKIFLGSDGMANELIDKVDTKRKIAEIAEDMFGESFRVETSVDMSLRLKINSSLEKTLNTARENGIKVDIV